MERDGPDRSRKHAAGGNLARLHRSQRLAERLRQLIISSMKELSSITIAAIAIIGAVALAAQPATAPATKPGEPAGEKVVKPSGLTIIATGKGEAVKSGDTVFVHY